MKKESSRKIGEILGDYVKESHLEDGLVRIRVFEAWDKLVPLQLTLQKSYRDKTLTCRLSSSVARTQLSLQKASLIERINQVCGDAFVENIILM